MPPGSERGGWGVGLAPSRWGCAWVSRGGGGGSSSWYVPRAPSAGMCGSLGSCAQWVPRRLSPTFSVCLCVCVPGRRGARVSVRLKATLCVCWGNRCRGWSPRVTRAAAPGPGVPMRMRAAGRCPPPSFRFEPGAFLPPGTVPRLRSAGARRRAGPRVGGLGGGGVGPVAAPLTPPPPAQGRRRRRRLGPDPSRRRRPWRWRRSSRAGWRTPPC